MKPNNPNTSIFSIALDLDLDSPWYVEDIKLLDKPESSRKELHLHLNFTRGHDC